MKRILILFAHPASHKSRIHRKLIKTAETVDGVTINNLYDTYPDFFIDVRREQTLLTEHDMIVMQHPFYWYSCPSLLKEWMDLVLEHNFAFGREGIKLKGKMLMSVISTGGSAKVYTSSHDTHYNVRELLAPFHQMARLCGMEYLAPFVVHGSHILQPADIDHYCILYQSVLKKLRDDAIDRELILKVNYINDLV